MLVILKLKLFIASCSHLHVIFTAVQQIRCSLIRRSMHETSEPIMPYEEVPNLLFAFRVKYAFHILEFRASYARETCYLSAAYLSFGIGFLPWTFSSIDLQFSTLKLKSPTRKSLKSSEESGTGANCSSASCISSSCRIRSLSK